MTDDEVVETSDPEELEEINAIARRTWLSPKVRVVTGTRQAAHEESNVDSPPRKRAKVSEFTAGRLRSANTVIDIARQSCHFGARFSTTEVYLSTLS